MPKIQLSALATDMKGKSGGSVFARNKGGLYFRGNPSPVQKKSAEWNSQKVRFSKVSSSWKALTDNEREAWEDMAVNYPLQNAWGNTYIPSGFQLYMKLNTNLISHGLPTLTTPLAPQELPIQDDVNFWCPENEAFTPQRGASLKNYQGRKFYLLCQEYCKDIYTSGYQMLSARFVPDLKSNYFNNPFNYASLFSLTTTEDTGIFAFVGTTTDKNFVLSVCANYQSNNNQDKCLLRSYDITEQYLSGQIHFCFAYNRGVESPDVLTYLNGVGITPIVDVILNFYVNPRDPLNNGVLQEKEEPVQGGNDGAGDLRIGNFGITNANVFVASDVRFWDQTALNAYAACSPTALCVPGFECVNNFCRLDFDPNVFYFEIRYSLIAKGYILGNETVITPLTDYIKSTGSPLPLNRDTGFRTYSRSNDVSNFLMIHSEDCNGGCDDCGVNDEECRDCRCIYVGDSEWTTPNLNATFSPVVYIGGYESPIENVYLGVYCTKPIGNGKSDWNSPSTLIATIPLNIEAFDLTSAIATYFPSVSANTKLVLSFKIINGNTGQATDAKPQLRKPKKRVIRFKAGSELSSSVN